MFLFYLATVWFTTWFIREQEIFDYIFVGSFLKKMRSCPICLGSWTGFALAFVFNVSIFTGILPVYPVFDQFFTAIVSSIGLYYLATGIKVIHTVEIIK